MIVFREGPSPPSRIRQRSLYIGVKWTKSSAHQLHVFLKVLSFGGAQLGGGKRSIQKRVVCEGLARPVEIAGKPKKLMSCLNNRGESLPTGCSKRVYQIWDIRDARTRARLDKVSR